MPNRSRSGSIAEDIQKLGTEASKLWSLLCKAAKSQKEMDDAAQEWQAQAKSILFNVEELKREANGKKFFKQLTRNRIAKSMRDIEQKLHQAKALLAQEALDIQEVNFPGDIISTEPSGKAFGEIMEALVDDDVNIIELYGLAGVGKTTLARQLAGKAKNSLFFKKVVMVSAKSAQGSNPDAAEIRGRIAKELSGLKLDQLTEEKKATELRTRLQQMDKVLIILDDVWGDIKLGDIGVPSGEDHRDCKVLLLTCFQHVCSSIKCDKTVKLDILTVDEAWTLFKQSAQFTKDYGRSYQKFMERLERLPFEVADIGTKLKGKREQELWKLWNEVNTNRASPHRLYEDVYKRLKPSYEYLNPQEKSMFLLCYMFPIHHTISMEELTRLAIGQGLFNDVNLIDDVRGKVRLIISKLQSGSLLQVVDQHSFKTISDLFGSFAHWLALQEDRILIPEASQNDFRDLGSCVAVSVRKSQLREIIDADRWNAPRLETLVIIDDEKHKENEYPISFFNGMKNLKALSLLGRHSSLAATSSNTEALPSLSLEGFQLLENLRMLQITAHKLSNIQHLGSLTTLEILAFNGCSFFGEQEEDSFNGSYVQRQQDELGKLNRLKLLDLSHCLNLSTISSILVQWLSTLEELYITDFGSTNESRIILGGLKSCDSLTVLSLKVPSESCPQELVLPTVDRYRIEIDGLPPNTNLGDTTTNLFPGFDIDDLSPRALRIKEFLLHPFAELLLNVEYLHLDNVISDRPNFISISYRDRFNSLKVLKLHKCKMDRLAGMTGPAFSNLTDLELVELPKLTSLWSREQNGSLDNLKDMKIRGCEALRGRLFPDLISQSLPQLKTLDIMSCSALEMIFSDPNPGNFLPKLTTITVADCDLLQHIFLGSEGILKLSLLQRLELRNLLKLNGICKVQCYIAAPLEELVIEECRKLEPFVLALIEGMKAQLKILRLQQVGLQANSSDYDTIIASLGEKIPGLLFCLVGNFEVTSQHHSGYFYGYYVSSLTELVLHFAPRIRVLWDEHTHTTCVQNLTRLELLSCERLSYVFTLLLAHNLTRLKYLSIISCDKLEKLLDDHDHHQDQPTACFPNLTEVTVKKCDSLRRLFPVNLALVPKLQRLHVANCPLLTMIFSAEVKADQKSQINMAFPRCEEISLEALQKFIGFAPVGYTVEFPSVTPLASIKISSCKAMIVDFWQDSSSSVHARTKKSEKAGPDDSVPSDWKQVPKLRIEEGNMQWPPEENITEHERGTGKEKRKESIAEKDKDENQRVYDKQESKEKLKVRMVEKDKDENQGENRHRTDKETRNDGIVEKDKDKKDSSEEPSDPCSKKGRAKLDVERVKERSGTRITTSTFAVRRLRHPPAKDLSSGLEQKQTSELQTD